MDAFGRRTAPYDTDVYAPAFDITPASLITAYITDQGIREGQRADTICSAIETLGQLLESHFPVKPDDTDELENLIVG